jgi:hypothetical protein
MINRRWVTPFILTVLLALKVAGQGSSNTAQFVKTDATTQGSWKGVYGGDGYNVIDDTTAYPSYVTVTPNSQSNYVWSGSTSDVRALAKAFSDTDRIEATWYTGGSFTIDMNFTDGATHQLAVYCLDESGGSRTETISVLDGVTSAVLDSRNVSNFVNGQYLVWNLSGHVVLNITNTGSPNAVISGLYFDVPGAVAPPWFDPPARVWSSAQSVSLTTMAGASIRYTTDGSTPSETAGTLYSGPITVNSTTTVKAMAYITGLNDSAVVSGTYTISPLPSPWTDQDIGAVGVAGSGAFDSTSANFTVQGSGTNVFYAPDQFNYLSQPLSGDGVIVARVVSEQNVYQATKAGVMIRETTDPSAAFAFVSLAPDSGGVYFSERPAGAGPNYNGTFSASAPVWVKLVRQGNTFTGYYSSDGNTWTAAGSPYTVSMAANVLVGLAVVSTYNSALTTAVFDNVSITSGIGVSVSPTTASLSSNQTQQFTATVTNTSNTAVTWSLSPTVGSISSTGLYTAPASIGSQQTVTVTATSAADSTKSASAIITLTPPAVATPVFSPAGGVYSSAQTVTISTTTSGASINYTTDGSMPSETSGTLYNGPITVSTTTTVKAMAYASGMPDSAVASANYIIGTGSSSAQFVRNDATTEGSWKGVYGGDGYNVIDDTTAYPSYVTVTPTGQSNYIWSGSTSDAWALEKAFSDSDRIEATWYTGGSFTIDMNFTDGATHQMAVYCLDESGGARTETISVLDAVTSAVLDRRNVSNFSDGQYLVWNLSGHVVLNIANTGSPNAVISGLFFDVPGAVAPPWFDPPARVWSTAQSVSLTTMAGASIRYTTDGSTPSETAGTLYSGPITVNSTTTIKAMAYITGFNDSQVASGTYTISPLPSPWTDQDIGAVGVAGSAAFDPTSTKFTVQGSGSEVFYAPDQFNYLSQPLSGDGVVVARVVSEQNLYQATKAGVMIRETTDPSAAFAFVSLAPDSGGVYFSERPAGAGPNYNGTFSASTPVWVKLVRQGNTFTGYYSSDGNTWTAAGSSFTVNMAANVLVGLAVVSTHNTALTTAVFDNVSITSGIDVSVSPTTASLSANQSQQFTATVTNTSNTAVTWSLSPTVGSISSTGLYTAPASIGSQQTVTVTATSVADSTKSASAIVTLSPPAVATPVFSPAGGVYSSAQTVTISTTTSGASINYTTYGSTPSETSGTLYNGPITVSSTTTINAIAFASGMTDSAVASANYTITAWYNASWNDRKSITINHTKVAGSSNLTNFPMLVSLTDANLATVANGGNVGLSDGTDILFTAADGATKLAHEIESYNPSTGQLVAWVNTPAVSPTSDTMIFMYYGNASATDQQNRTGVWDSNYGGVWHLGTVGGALSTNDSTSNANNATVIGTASVAAGEVGGGAALSGSPNYIDAGNSPSVLPTQTGTLSIWVNYNAFGNWTTPIGNGNIAGDINGAMIWNRSSGQVDFEVDGAGGRDNTSGGTLSTGQWYYLVGSWDGSNVNLYTNGVLTSSIAEGTSADPTYHLTLGVDGALSGSGNYLNGIIDEARVSKVARPAGWIGTEYNNQSSPSTFFSVGSQQGSGAPPQVASPTFSPAAGTYTSVVTVTISSATSGASIRYTTDGSTPTETAGTLYSGPITVSATTTINAIAYASGMADSSISTATYTLNISPPSISSLSPTSGPVGTAVTITGANFGPSQSGSTVTFNGTSAGAGSSWSNSSITVAVPNGASTGNVIVTVGGLASNGTAFTVNVSFASTTGTMQSPRSGETATRMANGNVLVAGGLNTSGVLGSSELYNPTSQIFSPSGSMASQRWMHSATLLNDGTVLIAGGSNSTTGTTLNSAEIYDPVAGTFTLLSNTLNTARAGHTATLLNNGQVLLVGGIDPTAGIIQDAELYDPPTQSFIDLGATTTPRFGHTATLLQNGQVLIAGGETDPIPSGAYNSAEIFDPIAPTFTPVLVPMTTAREGHAAVLLNNGDVLIAGGDIPGTGSLNSAEVYNPALGIFTQVAATMTVPRISHTMTLLNGGKVLIAGGASDAGGSSTVLNTAELFDPIAQTFTSAGTLTSAREHHSVSLINDGTVLLAGGTDGTNIFNSAELYMPSQLNGLVSIAVTPAAPSIGVGAQQSFTAIGTFSGGSTQTLASALWSSSTTTVAPVTGDSTNTGVAVAAAQGTTTITASATGVTGSTTLTVTAAALTSITLSPLGGAVVPLGETLQFSVTGVYSDGSTQDLTSSATWSSSNSSIAAISSGGLATGLLQGTTSIQASSGSMNAATNLSVGTPAIVSIAITPATATISLGSSQQYQVLGTYSNGSVQDVTTLMAWSSSATSVATVGITGSATGLSQGASTIAAAYESLSDTSSLTIGPPTLASIAITPNAATISNGGSQQLTATGTYTDGSTQNLTSSSTWTSSNSAVVAVNGTGLATMATAGESTITATMGSIIGTAVLDVTAATTQASLNTSRYQHSAITLNNGQILIAGGVTCPTAGSCSYLNSAEIYDPIADTFSNTGSLATARSAPAVLLNTGKVLVAGGYTCDGSGNCSSLNSVELYDPNAGTFSSAGTMTQSRTGHAMTLLSNGMVLIAGGQTCTSATSCNVLSSAEIYNPTAGTFTATVNSMRLARADASAVQLYSGTVLVAGGFNGSNLPSVVELYNPTTNRFASSTPLLNVPRFSATATILNNGQVLLAGGTTCTSPGCPTNAAEMYDPVANTFSLLDGLAVPRFDHTATLMTNGQVFIAGGYSSCGSSSCTSEATTEIYDAVAGTFSSGASLTNAVAGQTGTLAPNGSVLLMGGINAGVTVGADEWYQPTNLTPPGLVSIAVTPASVFLASGQSQQFTATGTFSDGSTQTLQSAVWNSSNPLAAVVSNSTGSAGLASGQSAGTTTLTATAGVVVGSASVSVAALVSIAVLPSNPSILVGSNQQLAASGTFSDGSTHNLTASVTWSSSNSSIVNVGNTPGSQGLATGVATGTATITAAMGGTSATTSITIPTAPSVTSVSPANGAAGMLVTIFGSNFGTVQSTGMVWLGSTLGAVVTWSNTQIVAAVASNATSGTARVAQAGAWSNSVPFTVNIATISSVTPASGMAGTQVMISGSGFGAAQGTGQVWLGTANGVVQSWSDTQIVALVAIGSASGNAQVLQNGVMSNALPFGTGTPQIAFVSPPSGSPGTSITIIGTGFGSSQGSGAVQLGSIAAQVVSWSDTQVVATVATGALTGIARVQQNGMWSNAKSFTVPGGSGLTLSPNLLNMVVGDTRTIQALNSAGQPVTGLTWASSNTNVVSLSPDDPPVLTALAAGHVTITAGTASADVTIFAAGAALPLGTVLWSVPTPEGGVNTIVPAVPSPTGIADVFAVQTSDTTPQPTTVQAITSDGTTAWSVTLGLDAPIVPDFQGGLVVLDGFANSISKLDGITGQTVSTYSPGSLGADTTSSTVLVSGPVAVHTDGTIFATQGSQDSGPSVIGIDPATGTLKFSVPLAVLPIHNPIDSGLDCSSGTVFGPVEVTGMIVAGDGYAYVGYGYQELSVDCSGAGDTMISHLRLRRVSSSGANDMIPIADLPVSPGPDGILPEGHEVGISLITNADTGVLLSWSVIWVGDGYNGLHSQSGMALTTGASLSAINVPVASDQFLTIVPRLQAQDGSFVGTVYQNGQTTMIAFDASGNLRWSVPNEQPQIATDDGGVIGQSGIKYDQNGNATGQIANTPTYSWQLNGYRLGSVEQVVASLPNLAVSFWLFAGGNASGNNAASKQPWYAPLKSCPGAPTPCPQEAIMSALGALRQLLKPQQACTNCNTFVFNKLQNITQNNFASYLSRQPRFWDGLRSYAPQHVGFCPSGFFNQFFCSFPPSDKILVRDYLLEDTTRDAVSQTPSDKGKGVQIFFNPTSGICNVLSTARPSAGDQGVLNQATLFHEALHGFTRLFDLDLTNKLNPPNVTGGSADITYYLMRQVIPGGAQGATSCGN